MGFDGISRSYYMFPPMWTSDSFHAFFWIISKENIIAVLWLPIIILDMIVLVTIKKKNGTKFQSILHSFPLYKKGIFQYLQSAEPKSPRNFHVKMASCTSSCFFYWWSMMMMMISVGVLVLMMGGRASGAVPKKAVDVPFARNYVPTWAFDHIKYFNGGTHIQLHLDNRTGTGFESKGSYLFGHFAMHIKMVSGDSAGTVTAFYLSSQNNEHDEIDFEFLGNRSGQPYILQTNVYAGGKGDKEQRIYLWFDPTKEFHSYSVVWNMYQIVFFVDDVPIRVFKNSKDLGLRYPFNQPMKIYSSLWNADDWATRGGLEKTNWSKAPFIASYKGFHIDGCEASVHAKFCYTQGKRWWDQKDFQDLDANQWRRLRWVRNKYTIYNYCTDRARYAVMPPECKRNRDV